MKAHNVIVSLLIDGELHGLPSVLSATTLGHNLESMMAHRNIL